MTELWPREREVLCLVALTNREIAARLKISHQTVKNHLTHVYTKLNVSGGSSVGKRVLALRTVLREELVTLDEIELPPPPPGWCWERFAQAQAAARREWMEKCIHRFCIN